MICPRCGGQDGSCILCKRDAREARAHYMKIYGGTKTQIGSVILPPNLTYCYTYEAFQDARDAVKGWTIEDIPHGVQLRSPEGKTMSPNMAPADVRDAFRAWRNR